MSSYTSVRENSVVLMQTKTRKSNLYVLSVLFMFISCLPLIFVLLIGDFQFPFPVRSIPDGFVWLTYFALFFLVLGGLYFVWYFLMLTRSVLELGETGVLYRTPFYSLYTSWENVERIGISSSGVESLLLRTTATVETFARWPNIGNASDSIPLGPFGKTYGSDALAEAFREWAPHLIQAGK